MGVKEENYSVKSLYHVLTYRILGDFPWKGVRDPKSSLGVAFLAWEATNEAILTGANLRICSKIYRNWCFMCKREVESVNLLIGALSMARQFWSAPCSSFTGYAS